MLNFILGKEITTYVKRHRGLLYCSIILTAVSSLFVLIPAYILQPFVDQGMKAGSEPVSWKIPWIAVDLASWSWHKTEMVLIEKTSPNRLLVILSLVAFGSVLVKSAALYLSNLSATAFANRAVKSLRIDLFRKFVSLPLGYYHQKRSGELIARATADLMAMQNYIAKILIGLIQHPLSALAFLAYLFFVNYKLTLLVFVVTPLAAGLIRIFGTKVKKHARKVQDAVAEVTASYQETLLCLKVVHGFCGGGQETRRFATLADHLYKRVMRWSRWNLGLSPIMDTAGFLVLPGVLIVGKIYFHHTLGELVSLVYAFARVFEPVKKLAKVNNDLRTLQGATQRVFGILQDVPSIQDAPGARQLPRHKDSIEFDRVSFRYDTGEWVLQDISFRLRAGELVAFVGSTGAGKSTLLDLVPRFYDVTRGKITIDGFDIREVTLDSLRRQVGIVNQDILLFHDTIANNIRYGNPRAGMGEIVKAAKDAHAHDFIMAQPEGYDTIVGDQGCLLSGGQKQRIAIARAILINASVLLLDEAASALDAESEGLVQRAVEKLKGTRTILVVAHRLSTILKADRIFVIEGGRIVESGTLSQLLSIKGRFRELYEMQYGTSAHAQ